MALGAAVRPLEGLPRLGPVLSGPTHSEQAYSAAESLRLNLYPWQAHALDVSMATNDDGSLLYREVAIVTSRQNGKSSLLKPRIVAGLSAGRRILHTAQTRMIPRNIFLQVAAMDRSRYRVREANGQEQIVDRESGGTYKIIAPQRGVRGESADDLIIDEVREFEDWDFIAAAEPTTAASEDPQIIYLSNAGSEVSVVLNDLRLRGKLDTPGLCYLEWSADPELDAGDRTGWMQANPAVGHGHLTMSRLEALYKKYSEAGEIAIWETEHLCRWVKSMAPRLVQDTDWARCRGEVETPLRPAMGLSVDADGKRASAALAWQQSDGKIALMITSEVTGAPINLTEYAVALQERSQEAGVSEIGFDPWTDQGLARYFDGTRALNGSEYANACERFVRMVETGQIVWQWADSISSDLPYASRKSTTGTAWIADRADQKRPITAVLAAIRAVWLASNPQIQSPSIY